MSFYASKASVIFGATVQHQAAFTAAPVLASHSRGPKLIGALIPVTFESELQYGVQTESDLCVGMRCIRISN